MISAEKVRAAGARRPDAAAWAALWGRVSPYTLIPSRGKTERRMVLVQWLIMPLVLAGCLFPPSRPDDPAPHVLYAAIIMALHPLFYAVLGRISRSSGALRDAALTATDTTVATLVFYVTAARPGYAQVLLYCAVALAATRYPARRAFGITSLVALLLTFAALLPLKVAPPTLASEIIGLYALTSLVGLLSQAEKAVAFAASENARLAQTVLQRNRELNALNGLAHALNSEASTDGVLQSGLAGMATALDLSSVRAYRVREGVLTLATEIGPDDAGAAVESRRRNEAGRATASGQTIVKGWRTGDHSGRLTPGPLCVSVPLTVQGEVRGVIQADLPPGTTTTTESTLETLEIFCGELAIALENALLRGEAHRTAILQEKNRIAQELHDTVLQMLFSIGLRLQWSLDRLSDGSSLREPLTEARRLSAQAGGELRSAIFTLSSDIADVGLVAAVERLVEQQAVRAGWTANVVVSGDAVDLSVLAQNAAHRVVREALMNAYKHAAASEIVASLRYGAESLTVVVQDNGVGISAEALASYRDVPDHFGLRTVAEQIEGLGGTLDIYGDEDEQGTIVRAVIPYEQAAGSRQQAVGSVG